MSRNNSRRQRVKTKTKTQQPQRPQQSQMPPQPAANSFAAAFVVPTEFVDFPTMGTLYPNDSPLFGLEKVEIKHMTAREEDILGNQDYISRGIVLDKLIESLLIDKNINASDLADVDKIAVLVTARKTGYGAEYKHILTCADCGEEDVFVFNLENLINNANDEVVEFPEEIYIDPESGTFDVPLSGCGYTATCRQINNEDTKYILDLEKQREKHSLDFNYTIELLRRMVISVCKTDNLSSATSDPGTIAQFLDFIPAQDSRKLKEIQSKMIPSFRMHEEVECPKCSSVSEREVPFSWAMFWGDTRIP